jgi:hypothetical protein
VDIPVFALPISVYGLGVNVLRCTVIDGAGATSFLAHPGAAPALAAACATNPGSLEDLLGAAERYFHGLRESVLAGLAVFEEHNAQGNFTALHGALDYYPADELPVFRVVDERTRDLSVSPVKAGVVIFNLLKRRIVQVQNTWQEIQRVGKAFVYEQGAATSRIFTYRIPGDWALVP